MTQGEYWKEQYDKEKQKRENLEHKLNGHKTREKILEEEVDQLKRLQGHCGNLPESNKVKKNSLADKSVNTSVGNHEDHTSEAITDLHINQPSPAGSNNGRVAGNTPTCSSSFEVLAKNSGLQQFEGTESPTHFPAPHRTQASQNNPQTWAQIPVRSDVQSNPQPINDSALNQVSPSPEKSDQSQFIIDKSEGNVAKLKQSDVNFCPLNPEAWNGTGARPKNSTSHLATQETALNPGSRDHSSGNESEIGQTSRKLVTIPKDGGSYRINHPLPPIDCGQDNSLTGISSIFSPGEDSNLDSNTLKKLTCAEITQEQLNDLNSGTEKSSDSSHFLLVEPKNYDFLLNQETGSKDVGNKEGILFPSLFSSPADSCPSKPPFQTQPQMSSDQDLDLVKKLQTIELELRKKVLLSAEEIDKISKCVDDASKMETQLKDYEIQIQKHQVYNSSVQNNGAELQRLRKENESLRQLLVTQGQQFGPLPSESDPGWVSVTVNQINSNQREYKTLEAKINELTSLNNQLSKANRKWDESWKIREQHHSEECNELSVKLQDLLNKKNELKRETDAQIGSLTDELKNFKCKQLELEQRDAVRESHLTKEQKLNKKIKTDLESLKKSKREMESQTRQFPNKVSELETELSIMKQQLTITMDDFNKEQNEKTVIEEELRKTKMSLESKLKNANSLLKKRNEEILTRDKMIADLKKQMDEMSAKLRTEERRSAVNQPSFDDQMSAFPITGQSDVFYPSASPAYNPNQLRLIQQQNAISARATGYDIPPAETRIGGEIGQKPASAEHLPESWSCQACTYINFPESRLCCMCNSARQAEGSMLYSIDDQQSLASIDRRWPGRTVPDTVRNVNVENLRDIA